VVDLSADFRHDAGTYAALYGGAHPHPDLLARFTCALPELSPTPEGPVAHPDCFTTATTLGAAPLVALGARTVHVSAITGSTGSGRGPKEGTHHPQRHANLWAYAPFAHRHAPEMTRLLGAEVHFAPHSGPFARGTHATIFATLDRSVTAEEVRVAAPEVYVGSPFVTVLDGEPRLKDVVGTNRCHLGYAARGREVVAFAVIDNLLQGAAGGAVQWMNRLAGLPEDLGLQQVAIHWG